MARMTRREGLGSLAVGGAGGLECESAGRRGDRRAGGRGSAIVNGRLLVVGEENDEGLLLDRIESQTAVLRYKGETRRFIVRRRD